MAILIKFTNPNVVDVTINIYRGTAELDRANLGVPMDTLVGRPTEYLDRTAVQGNTYYYVFETIGDGDRDISRNVKLIATETRGPGNNILKEGTRDLGYYDTLAAADLLDLSSLLAKIPGHGFTNTSVYNYWVKYARNGKVYFVPSNAFGRATIAQLKTLGLIGNGMVISQNGFNYTLRLVRGCSETVQGGVDFYAANLPNATNVNMDSFAQTCEFNDLMYPLVKDTPLGQRLSNKLNSTVAAVAGTGLGVAVQEMSADNARGATRMLSSLTGRLQATNIRSDVVATVVTVWPVLELIED